MTPLPGALKGDELIVWRLSTEAFFAGWERAEGAFRLGGRWSSPGTRVVYTAIDPSTAIMEVAVHKGFSALDAVPHTLLSIDVNDPSAVHVVHPEHVPNPNWLRPCLSSPGQKAFGDALLKRHPMIAIPSAVSTHSWNLLINADTAEGLFAERNHERFALDTRLHPGMFPAASG